MNRQMQTFKTRSAAVGIAAVLVVSFAGCGTEDATQSPQEGAVVQYGVDTDNYYGDMTLATSIQDQFTPVVVAGEIAAVGDPYSYPIFTELNGPKMTQEVTPVTINVTDILRNDQEIDFGPGLTVRDFPGQTYNGLRLSGIPLGTKVLLFIQPPAKNLTDGAQTATGVYVFDRDGIVDDITGDSISMDDVKTYLADPTRIPERMLAERPTAATPDTTVGR